MIETLAFCLALLFVFLAGQAGMRAGAFPALIVTLASMFAFLVTMRSWFYVTRLASSFGSTSLLVVTLLVFWAISLTLFYILLKTCHSRLEMFESVEPSLFGRVLGAAFGCVTGLVLVSALMFTLRLSAPAVMPSYKPAALPLPVDSASAWLYRAVETHIARVKADEPGHTLLPDPAGADSSDPTVFWR